MAAAATSRAHAAALTSATVSELSDPLDQPSTIHPEVQEGPAAVDVRNFNFWYGQNQAIHNVNLRAPERKVIALLGPSGCGKSTLLRSLNRLNDLIPGVRMTGDILLGKDSVLGPDVDVIELRKRMGMVFQKSNPFPMTIFENVVFPLRIDGITNRALLKEVCERSLKAAALWDEVKDRLETSALSLSGGQQQRLCIARAVAANPEVVLMDEPCSALDPIATSKIEDLMLDLKQHYTVIIVTHNMQQAARVSDYTALFYFGRLIEYGPTAEIFQRPRRAETADYIQGRFG